MSATPGYKTRPVTLSERITRRAVEILVRNGNRYNRERMFRELIPMVPPGVAIRKNEADRRQALTGRGNNPSGERKVEVPHADRVRFGARTIVREALNTGGRSDPWVKREGDDLVYLRPPRIIVSDRRSGALLMPVLNALAGTFKANENADGWAEVQLMAHEHGHHLATCPKGCKLVQAGEVGDLGE